MLGEPSDVEQRHQTGDRPLTASINASAAFSRGDRGLVLGNRRRSVSIDTATTFVHRDAISTISNDAAICIKFPAAPAARHAIGEPTGSGRHCRAPARLGGDLQMPRY
jgi:hypothetical protein